MGDKLITRSTPFKSGNNPCSVSGSSGKLPEFVEFSVDMNNCTTLGCFRCLRSLVSLTNYFLNFRLFGFFTTFGKLFPKLFEFTCTGFSDTLRQLALKFFFEFTESSYLLEGLPWLAVDYESSSDTENETLQRLHFALNTDDTCDAKIFFRKYFPTIFSLFSDFHEKLLLDTTAKNHQTSFRFHPPKIPPNGFGKI